MGQCGRDEPASESLPAPVAAAADGDRPADRPTRLAEDAAGLAEDAAGLAGDAAALAAAESNGSGSVPAPRLAGAEPSHAEPPYAEPALAEPPSRADAASTARGVFDAATTRRRSVVFEEDDELDVPDFLK